MAFFKADAGAGSPTDIPGVDYSNGYDWGAGSPTPVDWDVTPDEDKIIDYAAGSIPPPSDHSYLPKNYDTLDRYPDEGGVVVRMTGGIFQNDGPYYIRLENADGDVFPSVGYCYGMKPGYPGQCFRGPYTDTIEFALPPVPPGLYNVMIWDNTDGNAYGKPGVTSTAGGYSRIPTAIVIVRRQRFRETYRVRAGFPPEPLDTKAKGIKDEPKLP